MTDRKKGPSARKGTLVIIGGHEDHTGDKAILNEVARPIPDNHPLPATIAELTSLAPETA